MAVGDGPIASAVIIPDPEELPPPPLKRRQSSTSDSGSKRPRLSGDGGAGSPTSLGEAPASISTFRKAQEAVEPITERRKSSVQEERKRGQRLFGGLLSTLSQTTPNGQQKRRLEIERRQQDRVKQQKAEDEVRRIEKKAKLISIRKVEQVKFDQEKMQTRHSNMSAMAHFLYTKAEPRLYFMPWKLRPDEEERIKTQITDVEATIGREVAEFEARYPKAKVQAKTEPEESSGTSKETVGELATESPSVPNVQTIDTTNDHEQKKNEKHALEEHNGEVVVENEEDTVIY